NRAESLRLSGIVPLPGTGVAAPHFYPALRSPAGDGGLPRRGAFAPARLFYPISFGETKEMG
ncbi:MAG: hypothetical protein FWG32_06160, partial [Oscillospiraceae bacterium]|nr:hypothetical protein [Oscillospiraceae bacterium]